MDNEAKRGVPAWAWIVGLMLFVSICVCGVLVAAVAMFVVGGSPVAQPPAPVAITVVADQPATPPATATVPPTNTPAGEPTSTAPAPETETPPAGEAPTGPTGPTGDPNADVRARIEANVSDIRGLEPLEPIVTVLLSREELRQRVEEDLFAELTQEDARDFTLLLNAFDFVPRDFDYYNFTLDLYAEQIAGFYDPETNEFVVVSDDAELDALEQWTHAHEFVHALQDQYYDLDSLDDESLDSEASAALLSMVEGEAVLVQNLYLLGGYFSFDELNQMLSLSTETESPVFDSAPPVLANDLIFPYTSGYEFMQTLYNQGGFDAIDEAWANPPQSTEHILHPDRYLAGDMPQLVSIAPLTDTLGTGWRQLDQDVFGEFYLRQYLEQKLLAPQVDSAASGWGGDQYAVYWNEDTDGLVMVLRLAWDSAQDGEEFATALADYTTASYGGPGRVESDGGVCWQGSDVTCFYRLGDQSFIVRAPTLAMAQAIAAAQP